MATIELLAITTLDALRGFLESYEGMRVIVGPRLDFALRQFSGDYPPQALYIEDTCGTLEELNKVIAAAQQRQIPVFVGLSSVGLAHQDDLADAGVAITTNRDPASVAGWVAQQLGTRKRASATLPVVAIAGAKGGIGKTLVTHMLATGLARRGLRPLVVDGDIANSGLRPAFHIPPGVPTYVEIEHDGPGAWTPEHVHNYVYTHEASNVNFLLGPENAVQNEDIGIQQWGVLMQAVTAMEGFDVVLLDTGPEMKRRPYALRVAMSGGWVIFPTPPGRQEREGVGQALRIFQSGTDRDLTDRCLLLFMEPEQGVTMTIERIRPAFAQAFSQIRELGTLSRAPRQVSMAVESPHYICPLDVMPASDFTWAVHRLVDQLCTEVGLNPSAPLPHIPWQQRFFSKNRVALDEPAPTSGQVVEGRV